MKNTEQDYSNAAQLCLDVFTKKNQDYGTAWRILRPSSITDQIFIKASRIRSIQEKGSQKIGDDIRDEFIGIVNYSAMALIQLNLGAVTDNAEVNMAAEDAIDKYKTQITNAKDLMLNKNHDYNEAWRDMRISSLTDIILMKLFRLKQIEDNLGKVIVSEGPEGSYTDMINYAIFALIKIENGENY
ncbi:MAG: DUF1599 domain-containing protein [Bacteroidales bacterium]|nr:DUF1599 domain-containing protein [Bacteroidales bacterium]